MKPFREWPLAAHAILAVVVAGILFWVGWSNFPPPGIKAMREEIGQKKEELAKLNEEIQKGEVLEKKLPELKREIAALEVQLEDLKAIIPPIRDDAQLLNRVKTLADRSRLDVTLYSPQSLQDSEFYKEYPIQVSLNGTYHDLAVFFDRLRRQARVFNITNLRVSGYRAGRQTIQASFTVTTFIYKEDKPAPEAAATAASTP